MTRGEQECKKWLILPFSTIINYQCIVNSVCCSGISSWGRKVGRRLEQLSISDNETLTYSVNPTLANISRFFV